MPILALLKILLFLSINTNSFLLSSLSDEVILASRTISLENRNPDTYVNSIFKDNILLNMAYMEGRINSASKIDWQAIERHFSYRFELKPNETFAYHEDVLNEYQGKINKTTNAHFNTRDGFKSDGYLVGDGICHLASLIYWVAKDASLNTKAPTNHDFAEIPQVPKEFGVSIYYYPGKTSANATQNLYITNNTPNPVTFKFDYDGKNLSLSIVSVRQNIFSI